MSTSRLIMSIVAAIAVVAALYYFLAMPDRSMTGDAMMNEGEGMMEGN